MASANFKSFSVQLIAMIELVMACFIGVLIYYVSEVSKKKKDKYHIVMYTHGI